MQAPEFFLVFDEDPIAFVTVLLYTFDTLERIKSR